MARWIPRDSSSAATETPRRPLMFSKEPLVDGQASPLAERRWLRQPLWRGCLAFVVVACSLTVGFIVGNSAAACSPAGRDVQSLRMLQLAGYAASTEMAGAAGGPLERVILITATYPRAFQASHLTQLATAVCVAPGPVLWIIAEAGATSPHTKAVVAGFLSWCPCMGRGPAPAECGGNYKEVRLVASDKPQGNPKLGRGINQRNRGIEEVERSRIEGVIFFADDDNTYSPKIFQEIRKVKRVGIWPVGFLFSREYGKQVEATKDRSKQDGRLWQEYTTGAKVEHPWVEEVKGELKVVAWRSTLKSVNRKYSIDMASFAFRSSLLWETPNPATAKPSQPVRFRQHRRHLETDFLDKLIADASELEILAEGCTEVLVWHKHCEAPGGQPWARDWVVDQRSRRARRGSAERQGDDVEESSDEE